mgnify:CR=1 FL=1
MKKRKSKVARLSGHQAGYSISFYRKQGFRVETVSSRMSSIFGRSRPLMSRIFVVLSRRPYRAIQLYTKTSLSEWNTKRN